MKKVFLVLFFISQIWSFSQAEELLHTGEAIITLINYGSSWNVTFTFTAVSERWGADYNPTDDYEVATRTIPNSEYPSQTVALFDKVDDPIAGINPIYALGNYKISAIKNGVEQAYFYMDWRTSDFNPSADVYFKYDYSNNHFLKNDETQVFDGTQQTFGD
jgi:hypothetical protein